MLAGVAAIPTYIHFGDELIAGGEFGVKPSTLFPQLAGLATMMLEYQRVVPSGPDGITGGNYLSYYDGSYVKSWQASAGGVNTISIASAQWKANHHTGRTITITAGTGSGQTRTVASNTTTQITVTADWATPPDATSVFNLGPGELVQFHYLPNTLIPGAGGDCWFQPGTGSITPSGMLMQRLSEQYANQAPGFRMLKYAFPAGMTGWKTGGSAKTGLMGYYNDLKGIEEGKGNTLDVKAVVIDTATRDVFGANLSFQADLDNVIAWIRAEISATALIVLVSPHPQIARTSLPPMAPAVRAAIRDTVVAKRAAGDVNVVLYDMAWGSFTWNLGGSNTTLPADPRYFDLPTVIQTGIGLYNVIAAHLAPAVTVPLGQALAGVVMLGDSQFVGQGVNPLMALYANQPSMVGSSTNPTITTKPNVWIWDEGMQQLVLFDVQSNANTYGATGGMGPEVTLPRKLLKRFPQGVVIFKYAKNGLALTADAGALTGNGYLEDGSPLLEDIKAKWTKCRVACLQTTARSLDAVAEVINLGENDLSTGEAGTAAFEARADDFIDTTRGIFTTRAEGLLPAVWLQGPPSATEVAGGSTLGLATYRNRYRAKVLSLETAKDLVKVIRNAGPDDYELSRDGVHYGGESMWKLGDAFATAIIELLNSQDAVGEGATDGGTTDEGATDAPAEEGAESGSGGASDSLAPPTAEQQSAIEDALYEAPDVAAYTTPSGLSVQRRSVDDLLKLARYADARAARRRGLHQTAVRFD